MRTTALRVSRESTHAIMRILWKYLNSGLTLRWHGERTQVLVLDARFRAHTRATRTRKQVNDQPSGLPNRSRTPRKKDGHFFLGVALTHGRGLLGTRAFTTPRFAENFRVEEKPGVEGLVCVEADAPDKVRLVRKPPFCSEDRGFSFGFFRKRLSAPASGVAFSVLMTGGGASLSSRTERIAFEICIREFTNRAIQWKKRRGNGRTTRGHPSLNLL